MHLLQTKNQPVNLGHSKSFRKLQMLIAPQSQVKIFHQDHNKSWLSQKKLVSSWWFRNNRGLMSCLSKSHHLTYRHLNKKLIFYMNFLNLKLLQFKNRSKNLNQTKLSKRNKIRQVKYSQPLEKKYVRQDLSGSVKQKLYNVCYRQLKPMKMKK